MGFTWGRIGFLGTSLVTHFRAEEKGGDTLVDKYIGAFRGVIK